MINWTIENIEYSNDADKGVLLAHYRVLEEEIVDDRVYTASHSGTVSFEPDASADGYVAFDALTEETVIGWVKDSLDVEEIESSLTAKIESQKAPATLSGTPW